MQPDDASCPPQVHLKTVVDSILEKELLGREDSLSLEYTKSELSELSYKFEPSMSRIDGYGYGCTLGEFGGYRTLKSQHYPLGLGHGSGGLASYRFGLGLGHGSGGLDSHHFDLGLGHGSEGLASYNLAFGGFP